MSALEAKLLDKKNKKIKKLKNRQEEQAQSALEAKLLDKKN